MKKVVPNQFNNTDEDTYVLYTTETLEDLIKSYKRYEPIDLSKVQDPVKKLVYR